MGSGRWAIPDGTKSGKKFLYFIRYQHCKETKNPKDLIQNKVVQHKAARSSLEKRLKSKVCELCGNENTDFYKIHYER